MREPRLDGFVTCVIMSYIMRTATLREMQHNLSEVLSWVERGEEVQVLRRNKVVARLLPPGPPERSQWPDFVARARAIWGDAPVGSALSALANESRGGRGFTWIRVAC